MRYRVFMKEVHLQEIKVDAESKTEAKQLALDGEGDYGRCEYLRTLEDTVKDWVVEEV